MCELGGGGGGVGGGGGGGRSARNVLFNDAVNYSRTRL